MAERKQISCYLCAEPIGPGECDDEHVFPECLFSEGDRAGLITLPAHRRCNADLSKDDDYFRLCMTTAATKDPRAMKLWSGPVLRSVHRPQAARYRQYILGSIDETEVRTGAGVVLGKATVMKQDASRIQRVVRRMARGVHTHLAGDILPVDWPVSCDLMDPRSRTDPGLSLFYNRVRSVGNGTVKYVYKFLDEDRRDAFLWLVFYDSIDFWAFIGTKIRDTFDELFERLQKG